MMGFEYNLLELQTLNQFQKQCCCLSVLPLCWKIAIALALLYIECKHHSLKNREALFNCERKILAFLYHTRPIPLRNTTNLVGWAAVLLDGNWFYQRLFQSITGSPHHRYTSQACSPLSIHITSEADWTKSGTGRIWLPAPPRKNPGKMPELDTHTHSVIYWSVDLYPFQSSGHPKFYPSDGHAGSIAITNGA